MSRYTGPKARRWRRLGTVPADGPAAAVGRRNYPPGQHGTKRQSKPSEYAIQLREKQKAKYTFGVQERQFLGYYKRADRKAGVTGENLMRLLELRLDNVVYRLGFARSRNQARQAVGHGHLAVNDRKVSIPSFQLSPGDVVSLLPSWQAKLDQRIDRESLADAELPSWLSRNAKKLTGEVLSQPERSELEASINEQLIVEFYSR